MILDNQIQVDDLSGLGFNVLSFFTGVSPSDAVTQQDARMLSSSLKTLLDQYGNKIPEKLRTRALAAINWAENLGWSDFFFANEYGDAKQLHDDIVKAVSGGKPGILGENKQSSLIGNLTGVGPTAIFALIGLAILAPVVIREMKRK